MHKIKKAIIPVAGYGTRLFPATKVMPKAFLPIFDKGNIKPVILKLVEELADAQIEEICLIVSKNDKFLYEQFFSSLPTSHLAKLKKENLTEEQKIVNLGKKIKYIIQEEQLGFGHAVSLSEDFAQNQPVLMILGDTLYKSNTSQSCTEQLLTYFDHFELPTISLQEVADEDIQYLGISKGIWDNQTKQSLTLETIVEKPTVAYAHENLLIDHKIFGNFGAFILNKDFFQELKIVCSQTLEPNQEYQLMDAFASLMKKSTVKGFVIDGSSYDMGNTKKYQELMKQDF